MWLLYILPDALVYAVTTLSFLALIVTFALSNIPLISKYAKPTQLVSGVLFLFGVYLCGGISNEASWREKVAKMEVEIAQKEAASAEASTKVITKYVDRVTVVKEKGDVITKEIPNYISKDADAKCTITNGFVSLHDAAAKNEIPNATRDANEGTSAVKISGVAETVTTNYTTYYQVSEQLKALQEWVREQQKVFNK